MGCSCIKSKCVDTDEDLVVSLVDSEPSINDYGTANVVTEGATKEAYHQPVGRCVDICGFKSHCKFIILSGTHCVAVQSLQDELPTSHIYMKPLQEVCKYGDHYLAQYDEYHPPFYSTESESEAYPSTIIESNFFIIKGASCIEVKNLSYSAYVESCEKPNRIYDLHPECQGDSTYLEIDDMSKEGYRPETASRHKLHETFTNGLCYFATNSYFYVVKAHAEFGVVYYRTKDLRSDRDVEMLRVSSSIASTIVQHSISLLNDEQISKVSKSKASKASHSSLPSQCLSAESMSDLSNLSANAKPNFNNLTVIKWQNKSGEVKTFHLKIAIMHRWREIGNLAAVPWQQLEAWARRRDDKECCEAVFLYWLENPPYLYPATWKGLYELLEDCELGQVATDLKQAVENSIY